MFIKADVDNLLISETKLNITFPDVQFYFLSREIFRKRRNCNGCGLLL